MWAANDVKKTELILQENTDIPAQYNGKKMIQLLIFARNGWI